MEAVQQLNGRQVYEEVEMDPSVEFRKSIIDRLHKLSYSCERGSPVT